MIDPSQDPQANNHLQNQRPNNQLQTNPVYYIHPNAPAIPIALRNRSISQPQFIEYQPQPILSQQSQQAHQNRIRWTKKWFLKHMLMKFASIILKNRDIIEYLFLKVRLNLQFDFTKFVGNFCEHLLSWPQTSILRIFTTVPFIFWLLSALGWYLHELIDPFTIFSFRFIVYDIYLFHSGFIFTGPLLFAWGSRCILCLSPLVVPFSIIYTPAVKLFSFYGVVSHCVRLLRWSSSAIYSYSHQILKVYALVYRSDPEVQILFCLIITREWKYQDFCLSLFYIFLAIRLVYSNWTSGVVSFLN